MDHPDLPADLRLPKKKKKVTKTDKTPSTEKVDRVVSRYTPSIRSTGSLEKRSTSPASRKSGTPVQTIAPHPAVAPLHPGPRHPDLDYSWRLKPRDEQKPERRFGLLSSRRSKTASVRKSEQVITENPTQQQQQYQQQEQQRQYLYPQDASSTRGSRLYPPNPSYESMMSLPHSEPVPTKSWSQPPTPSWLGRQSQQVDTHAMPQTPPLEGPCHTIPIRTRPPQRQDLALFAAATAGLSPEQFTKLGQAQQNIHLPPSFPSRDTSNYSSVDVPSTRTNRALSSSSSSHRAPSIAPSALSYSTSTVDSTNRIVSDGPAIFRDSTQRGGYEFPTGHPLSRWPTQSSRGSNTSEGELPRIGHSQEPFATSGQTYVVDHDPVSPDDSLVSDATSRTSAYNIAAGRTPSPLHIQPQTSNSTVHVVEPVSPEERDEGIVMQNMPWLHDNVSALTIDTTHAPHTANRVSAISTISGISDLLSDVSPIDPEDEYELPDYQTSQEEMARMRQMENTRRAQELQRRWMQSRGS